jgi:hypothetical protein
MKGVFLSKGDYYSSAWEISDGYLVIISIHPPRIFPALLHVGLWKPKISLQIFLKKLLEQTEGLDPLDPAKVRPSFKSNEREAISLHLLAAQNERGRQFESVIEEIAWRYVELINWGEASAAKVLAVEYNIPIRTMHTRLRLARDRKLISSPGVGARLNGAYEPALKRLLK